MFFQVFLHIVAHKLVTHKWCIEFYNVHGTCVDNTLTLSGVSYPILRIGSLFLPFFIIDFQWSPLIIACFLISMSS
jgi:hypothetical protein